MFTKGFVPATSPWVGTSSAQPSAEGMGTAGTTLFLTESAFFVDRFVPTQQCLPLSFASGVQHTSFISVNDIRIYQYLYETLPATQHVVVVVVVVVSHIQRIGCQPEKTTLHGGQSRSWSAEQGKENKIKRLAAYPPPTPHTARWEKINKITRRIYRRYAGGRSRVRTRIPSARRLGLWVWLRKILHSRL